MAPFDLVLHTFVQIRAWQELILLVRRGENHFVLITAGISAKINPVAARLPRLLLSHIYNRLPFFFRDDDVLNPA